MERAGESGPRKKNGRRYVVAGTKPWTRRVFGETLRRLPGTWTYVDGRDRLTVGWLDSIAPRYVFFLHWSWRVPPEVTGRYECVGFHMTDVPYGRGGSPLQNLIRRGHRRTRLSALRMGPELDAGPVYGKEEMSLEGDAEEIYTRAARLSAKMIARIVRQEPAPRPQRGRPVVFRRRSPAESELPRLASAVELYDFIRMLDAPGYPHAFLVHGGFRYEFRRAVLRDGRVRARVTVTRPGDART